MRHPTLACAVPLLFLTACSTGPIRGSDQVQSLTATIQQTDQKITVAEERLSAAVATLEGFVAARFGADPLQGYAELQRAVAAAVAEEVTLRDAQAPMQAAAEHLFTGWNDGLDEFASAELRQCSAERLAATKARFEAVADGLSATVVIFADVNQLLQDHVRFFGRDLNAESLAAVRGSVREVATKAALLRHKLGDCRQLARAYVDAAALPQAAAPAAPER